MTVYSTRPDDRVMVFIDLRNITEGCGPDSDYLRIDLEGMTDRLCDGRRLMRAFIFDGKHIVNGVDVSKTFHDILARYGFTMVARDCCTLGVDRQKEVDVALGCEMVVRACRDQYDVAVLVSGDRDFVPAVEHVQDMGKRVEVASFDSSASIGLRRVCDRFRSLDEMPVLMLKNPCLTEVSE